MVDGGDMYNRFLIGLAAAGAVWASSAVAQSTKPSMTAEQFKSALQSDSKPSFTADQLAAILAPSVATRSLIPGTKEPGTAGSGVIPDLRLQFAANSAKLTPSSTATLRELGKALTFDELRDMHFEIGGHTDAKGNPSRNEKLSWQRAEAVVSFLVKDAQVEKDRLKAVGYGPKQPINANDPASAANRRVEVRTVEE